MSLKSVASAHLSRRVFPSIAAGRSLLVFIPLVLLLGLALAHNYWPENLALGGKHNLKPHKGAHGTSHTHGAALQQPNADTPTHSTASSRSQPSDRDGREVQQQIDQGIKRLEALLPLAKQLTLASLKNLAPEFHLQTAELRKAEHHLKQVDQIVLDEWLGSDAAVDSEEPAIISVGPDYAIDLGTDEEALLLLSHELTHVAARSGNLTRFFSAVAERARRLTGVDPAKGQEEDLGCDFIAEQAVKSLISLRPTAEPASRRMSRALEFTCGSHWGEVVGSDEEHLSSEETLRALRGLDAELSKLLPECP